MRETLRLPDCGANRRLLSPHQTRVPVVSRASPPRVQSPVRLVTQSSTSRSHVMTGAQESRKTKRSSTSPAAQAASASRERWGPRCPESDPLTGLGHGTYSHQAPSKWLFRAVGANFTFFFFLLFLFCCAVTKKLDLRTRRRVHSSTPTAPPRRDPLAPGPHPQPRVHQCQGGPFTKTHLEASGPRSPVRQTPLSRFQAGTASSGQTLGRTSKHSSLLTFKQ